MLDAKDIVSVSWYLAVDLAKEWFMAELTTSCTAKVKEVGDLEGDDGFCFREFSSIEGGCACGDRDRECNGNRQAPASALRNLTEI